MSDQYGGTDSENGTYGPVGVASSSTPQPSQGGSGSPGPAGPPGPQGPAGPSGADVLTTKGDLLGFALEAARFPVDPVDGKVLVTDSSQAFGIKWASLTNSGHGAKYNATGTGSVNAGGFINFDDVLGREWDTDNYHDDNIDATIFKVPDGLAGDYDIGLMFAPGIASAFTIGYAINGSLFNAQRQPDAGGYASFTTLLKLQDGDEVQFHSGTIPGANDLTKAFIQRRETTVINGGGGAGVLPSRFEHRMTIISGNPIGEDDLSGHSTLYLTPYIGLHMSLLTGGVWTDYQVEQISITDAGLVALTVYDVYVKDMGGGNVVLSFGQGWEEYYERNDGDDIVQIDGVWVHEADHSRRHIGTILTQPGLSALFVDSTAARFISNRDNPIMRAMGPVCSGYADVNQKTVVTETTQDNIWKYFFHPGVDVGNYVDWVLCEPRVVQLEASFSIENINADAVGCAIAIGQGPEPEDQSLNDVKKSTIEYGVDVLQDTIMYTSTRPPGACMGYQMFVGKGGTHTFDVIASDENHGQEHASVVTAISGWIEN